MDWTKSLHSKDFSTKNSHPYFSLNHINFNPLAFPGERDLLWQPSCFVTPERRRCLWRCEVLQMGKQESVTSYEFNPVSAFGSNDPALGRLLLLFPSARQAHIPVRVGLPGRSKGAVEKTTIMFRSHDTAIFLLDYPLHGGDAVQLRSVAGPRESAAQVVALMPNGQGSAVAVRFLEEVPKWLLKA